MGSLTTKPLRILVAGGRGFLGGRIAAHLAEAGHHIILGSRIQAVAPPWLPQAKTALMQWDDPHALKDACQRVDVVVHAAGMNAKDCTHDPVKALTFNGAATARLVEAASAAKVKQFIYLSTAHVYAAPLSGVISEENCPTNLHPYATSHLAGEHAVLHATELSKIHGTVLRVSNAFGAPMDNNVDCWTLLANDLCQQAVKERQLELKTSGQQQRDFISIGDVCHVVNCLIKTDTTNKLMRVVNVGSGVSRSVLDFAEYIQQRCNKILGFLPKINKPNSVTVMPDHRLSFQIERLTQLNILLSNNGEKEIDNLLTYCQAEFALNRG